jgi:hypothetical protein
MEDRDLVRVLAIPGGRHDTRDAIESELRIAFELPVVALRGDMRAVQALDRLLFTGRSVRSR